MRLLFNALSFTNAASGTRTRLQGIVPELLKREGLKVGIVHQPDVEFPALEDCAEAIQWYPRSAPRTPLGRALRETAILSRVRRDFQADFVLSDCLPLPRVPGLVATIHDLRHYHAGGPRSLLWERSLRRGLRHAAAVHCVSLSVARELAGLIHDLRIAVVPNGVDLEHFQPEPQPDDALLLDHYGIEGSYLLSVGHFEDRKDPGLPLQLRAHLLAKKIPIDLVMVGRGPGLPERGFAALFAQNGGKDCGRVLRDVPDAHLPALMRQAWAVLAPARLEGFGLTPLEAAACGSVVLASSIPAHREVLGNGALYAKPGQVEGFLRHVIDLRHDGVLRMTMRRRARERAEFFSWSESARHLVECLGPLLAGRP